MTANKKSLFKNIVGLIGLVLLINGLIFGLGWSNASANNNQGLLNPPGYIVGSVWIILFIGLGVARWQLRRSTNELSYRRLLDGLILACLLYPFYALTSDFGLLAYGGTIITLVYSLLAVYVLRTNKTVLTSLSALTLWLCYASLLTVQNV